MKCGIFCLYQLFPNRHLWTSSHHIFWRVGENHLAEAVHWANAGDVHLLGTRGVHCVQSLDVVWSSHTFHRTCWTSEHIFQ